MPIPRRQANAMYRALVLLTCFTTPAQAGSFNRGDAVVTAGTGVVCLTFDDMIFASLAIMSSDAGWLDSLGNCAAPEYGRHATVIDIAPPFVYVQILSYDGVPMKLWMSPSDLNE